MSSATILMIGALVAPAASASVNAVSPAATLTTGAGASQPGPTVTVATRAVYEPGTYRISARAVVDHVSADPVDLVSVSLGCRDGSGREQRVGQFMNTLAVAPVSSIEPDLIFHARDDFTCWLAARGMRIKLAPGVTGPQKIEVRSASLSVERTHYRSRATEVHDPFDKTERRGQSRLVYPRTNAVVSSTKTNLIDPQRDYTLTVTGDLQLTSCTHVFGSSDETTNGEQLCARPGASMEQPSGPVVYTQLFVRQMRPDGSVCRTIEVPGARTYARLSALRHHAPRDSSGVLELSGSTTCGSEIRPFIRMAVSRGPAVMVHWSGTNVTVTPEAH